MRIPDWIFFTYIIAVGIVGVVFCYYFIKELIAVFLKARLRRMLLKGLLADDLIFSDFKNLQFYFGLKDRQVHAVLISMKAEIDYGDNENRSVLKPRLDSLIAEFNIIKPYSELPEGLVEPLSEARSNSSHPKLIDDLAEKILIHLRRKKKVIYTYKLLHI